MNLNKRVGEYVAFINEIMGKIPFNNVLGIRVELIKAYSSVAFSSPKLANGTAYDVGIQGGFQMVKPRMGFIQEGITRPEPNM